MDSIAKWMGYTTAVNYTGKRAYFVPQGEDLIFICNVKDYDPRVNVKQFMAMMDKFVDDEGGTIKVSKVFRKVNKYSNIQVIAEVSSKVITITGLTVQVTVSLAIKKYVESITKK